MNRAVVIALLIVAGVSVLLGGMSASWWAYESGDWNASIGLRESNFCNAGECRATALGTEQHEERWVRSGAASYAAALLSSGLIFAVVMTLLLGRVRELLVKTALVASFSAAVSGGVFVWLAPDYQQMELGISAYAYLSGSLLGIGACIAALRVRARGDDDGTSAIQTQRESESLS